MPYILGWWDHKVPLVLCDPRDGPGSFLRWSFLGFGSFLTCSDQYSAWDSRGTLKRSPEVFLSVHLSFPSSWVFMFPVAALASPKSQLSHQLKEITGHRLSSLSWGWGLETREWPSVVTGFSKGSLPSAAYCPGSKNHCFLYFIHNFLVVKVGR